MFNTIRFWFIKILAGRSTVVLNAHFGGGQALLTIKPGPYLVTGNVIKPWRDSEYFA